MKLLYTLLLCVILSPALSYAQSNYKPGYVVDLKGDTLRGFINYKQWDNNPKSFGFKKELKQPNAEVFSVKEATAIAVTGQIYYQRYVVSVSQDKVDMTNMNSRLDTSSLVDTVFLRLLNKGRYLYLYAYKDDLKSRFYALEAGQSQPYELVYHAYSNFNRDESTAIQYVRRYRMQLADLVQKNNISLERLSRDIAQSDYQESDLTSVAQKINGNASRQFTPPNLFGIRFFAGAGVNYSQSKFSGLIDFSDAPASKSTGPKIDAGVDLLINKDIQKFFLRAELSFSVNGSYTFTSSNVGTAQGTETLSFKQYNTSFTPQFVYNVYNKDKFKVFIDAGFAINLAMYNDYKTVTVFASFPSVVQDRYPEFEKTYFSFPLKAGLVTGKTLEIYLGYIPPAPITQFVYDKNAISVYQAGLNYLFK